VFHDWVSPAADLLPFRIFGAWVPHPDQVQPWLQWGAPLLWLAFALALLARRPLAARLGWVAVAATYALVHMYCARVMDDVFVNLEHPYNLWHHGRFSVDPERMVDGTTELPFYLALTPFAATPRLLFRANYVLGMLLGGAHLWQMRRMLPRVRPEAQGIALGAAALSFPFVQNFGCCYGNLAVSLACLVALEAVALRRERAVVVVCFAAPLLRLDGALFAAALGLAWWWTTRRFPWRHAVGTAAAILCSLAVYQALYGHPVATPIQLRAVSFGEFLLITPEVLARRLIRWAEDPAHLACFALILGVGLSRWTARRDPVGRALAPWLVATAPIALYYSTATLRGWNPLHSRYFMPFEVALTLAAARELASLADALLAGDVPRLHPLAARAMASVAVLLASLGTASRVAADPRWPTAMGVMGIDGFRAELKRITYHAWAGRTFDRVTPAGWTIAATEMDSFGIMNDRRIVDLWGFSNRALIADSVKTSWGLVYSMRAFLSSGAEVAWIRTHYNLPFVSAPAAQIEPAIFRGLCMGQGHPSFGDLREVTRRYDLVRVNHGPGCASLLLVKRERYAELEAAWRRHGWRPTLDRALDRAEIERRWETDTADGPFGAYLPPPPARSAREFLRKLVAALWSGVWS
jgi:hypothetical protein